MIQISIFFPQIFSLFFLSNIIITLFFNISFANEKTLIAILPLNGENIPAMDLTALTNRLQYELYSTHRYTVLEQDQIDAVLNEHKFQKSDCVDMNCTVEKGKLLKVEFVITGNLIKKIDGFILKLEIISVKSKKIINSIQRTCNKCTINDVLLRMLRSASWDLTGLSESSDSITNYRDVSSYRLKPIEEDLTKLLHSYIYNGKEIRKLAPIIKMSRDPLAINYIESSKVFLILGYPLLVIGIPFITIYIASDIKENPNEGLPFLCVGAFIEGGAAYFLLSGYNRRYKAVRRYNEVIQEKWSILFNISPDLQNINFRILLNL